MAADEQVVEEVTEVTEEEGDGTERREGKTKHSRPRRTDIQEDDEETPYRIR